MAIKIVKWDFSPDDISRGATGDSNYGGYDVHVLRNNIWTEDLRKSLLLYTTVNNQYNSLDLFMTNVLDPDFQGATITPSFKDGKAAAYDAGSKVHTLNNVLGSLNYKVEFDSANWRIRADAMTSGSDYHKNFNFYVTVEIKYGNPLETRLMFFRVHIHENISRVWLTPKILTVQKNISDSRFSVYAKFSDGTVGDISRHPGIWWPGVINPNTSLTEVPAISNITFNSKGGITSSTVNSTPVNVTVKIDAGAAINNTGSNIILAAADQASVAVEDYWNASPPTKIFEAVNTDASPKPQGLTDDGLHVLFVSDGFQSGEQNDFMAMTLDAVRYLKTSEIAQPWGHLSENSVKYWRLSMPSRDKGASCLNEIIVFNNFIKTPNASDYQTSGSDYIFSPKLPGGAPDTPPGVRWKTVGLGIDEYILMVDKYLSRQTASPVFERYSNVAIDPQVDLNARIAKKIDIAYGGSNGLEFKTLVQKIGLPTPKDNPATAIGITNLLTKWVDLYDKNLTAFTPTTPPTPTATNVNIRKESFEFWLDMSHRHLLEECDTTIGMATGFKPQLTNQDCRFPASKVVTLHPFRTTRDTLSSKLQLLGGGVTNIWAKPQGQPLPGRSSYPFVSILSAHSRSAAVRSGKDKVIGIGTSDSVEIYFEPVSGDLDKMKLIPYDLPTSLLETTKGVIAHELAHNLSLGDEYAEFTEDIAGSSSQVAFINSGSPFIRNTMNLMIKSDAESSLDLVNADKIRWRWLRISGGAVIKSSISHVTGSSNPRLYKFDVPEQHSKCFAQNMLVRIRKRNLELPNPSSQTPNSQYSPLLEIDCIDPPVSGKVQITVKVVNSADPFYFNGGISPNALPSPSGGLVAFDDGDVLLDLIASPFLGRGTVKVTFAGGGTGTVAGTDTLFKTQFLSGYKIAVGSDLSSAPRYTITGTPNATLTNDVSLTISYTGTQPPDITTDTRFYVVPNNEYMELLHDTVRIAMNHSKKPVTKVLTSTSDSSNIGYDIQFPFPGQVKSPGNIDIFEHLDRPLNVFRVVGLYNGGSEYNYGVYHPTGYCAMREGKQVIEDDEIKTIKSKFPSFDVNNQVKGFCPVCSYIMVDLVDPSCHGVNNNNYEIIYPQLKNT